MTKTLIDLSRANKPTAPIHNEAGPEIQPTEAVPEVATVAIAPLTVVVQAPTDQVQRVSTIGARIPEKLHQNIKLYCITHRLEMQQFVQDALAKHLAELQSNQA